MPVITVDEVTFELPKFDSTNIRDIRPGYFTRKVLHTNSQLPPYRLTKGVLTKGYQELIKIANAKAATAGGVQYDVNAVNRMKYLWDKNAYWDHKHALDTGISHPPGERVLRDKLQIDQEIYELPAIEATHLEHLRPADMLRRLKDENISIPCHYFTKAVIMRCYEYLITKAHADALVPGTPIFISPYIDWFRSWRKDLYWKHQHALDIAKAPGNLSAPSTNATTTPASGVESESFSDSEDGITGVIDGPEAPPQGPCSDSEPDAVEHTDSHKLDIPHSTSGDEQGRARGHVSSVSPATSSSSPSTSRAQLRSSSKACTNVHQASSFDSPPPISSAPPSEEQVATQGLLHKSPRTSTSQPSLRSPASNSSNANPPISNSSSLKLSQSAFIGDEVYRLPSPGRFVLARTSLKFFRNDFLKFNRDKSVQLITAEVLVEAYRIFIVRFFPFAPEKSEVLNRATSYYGKKFLEEHTAWLARLRSLLVPEVSSPAAFVQRPRAAMVPPTVPTIPTIITTISDPPDVEFLRARSVPRLSASDPCRPSQQVRNTFTKEVREAHSLSGRSTSTTLGNTAVTSRSTPAQATAPRAQLLIDNMLYTMPMASRFPLAELTVMSFSRAMYRLNAHYPARDLSQPLILKAYKSFIFNQYPNASFEAKMSACQKLDWPTPPVAAKEYLRNLEILERTQKKIGIVPATVSLNTNADATLQIVAESKRARRREDPETSLFITPSPQGRRTIPSKRPAEANQTGGDVEAPLVRKRKQTTEGVGSHAKHMKKRRRTEDPGVGAGGPMFMSGALAFRPSPVPAGPSAETADGTPHRRRKKARKTRDEAS